MDKHSIRTKGLNKLISFLKSNLEGQKETEYKLKMQDRLGSVNLTKVNSYPSTKFLEYLTEDLSEIKETEEFINLFNDALRYTVTHLGFSGNEDLIEEFIDRVEENFIYQNFEVDTDFILEEFVKIDVYPKGVEDYSRLKVIPVLDEEEIGKFELDPPYICPEVPIQVKCRYKGKEVSKVFESSETKDFDFSKNRASDTQIDNVDKILKASKDVEQSNTEDDEDEEVYNCENCGDQFLSKKKLEEHLKAQKSVKKRNKVGTKESSEGKRTKSEKNNADENHSRFLNRKNIALAGLIILFTFAFIGFSEYSDNDSVNNPTEIKDNSTNNTQTKSYSVENLNLSELESDIRTQINIERSERNLTNFSNSEKLGEIANNHAESMARRGNLTHYSMDGLNTTERFKESGYVCSNFDVGEDFAGTENIYLTTYGFADNSSETGLNTSEELRNHIVNALLVKESIRDSLINPEINFQGIGIATKEIENSNAKEIYVAQDLC